MLKMTRKFDESVWDEDWFVRLTPKMKALWFYIWSKVNEYGVWNVNQGVAWALIGDRGAIDHVTLEKHFNSDGKMRVSFFSNGHKMLNHKFIQTHYGDKISLDTAAGRNLYVYLMSENLEKKVGGVHFIGNPVTAFAKIHHNNRKKSNLRNIILNLPEVEPTTFSPYMEVSENGDIPIAAEMIIYNPQEAKKIEEPIPGSGIDNLVALKDLVAEKAKTPKPVIIKKIQRDRIIKIVSKDSGIVVDYSGYTHEQITKFAAFETWVSKNARMVFRMKFPFSISEYTDMISKYDQDFIREMILRMSKSKNFKNHHSAYVCFNGQVKRWQLMAGKERKKLLGEN